MIYARLTDRVPVQGTDPLGTTGKPKGVVRENGGHAFNDDAV
ncbi:hypothetical protein [Thiothrix nivea]|nr:hypothetical protein [Thiothrix nivea]